jgi:hypothetical protein
LSSVLVIVAAACHDAPTQLHPQSPLVGQWMLETHPDTFVFVTGPSYVDCQNVGDYCTHYRTTVDSAYLGGMLQVQDSLGPTGVVAASVQATGTLTQRFCDSIDYDGLTGCTHVGTMGSGSYVGDIVGTRDRTTTRSLDASMMEVTPGTSTGRMLTLLDATYAGDSIYGRFMWGVPGHSAQYRGAFVMRRVH